MNFLETINWHEFIPLAAAVVLGGLIGLEREIHRKPAGLRTHILICLGAALFSQVALKATGNWDNSTRILQGIITGVGFIGAGAVIQDRGGIYGLTSAATIWTATAIGIACGTELYTIAIFATIAVLIILIGLNPLDRKIKEHIQKENNSQQKADPL